MNLCGVYSYILTKYLLFGHQVHIDGCQLGLGQLITFFVVEPAHQSPRLSTVLAFLEFILGCNNNSISFTSRWCASRVRCL